MKESCQNFAKVQCCNSTQQKGYRNWLIAHLFSTQMIQPIQIVSQVKY